MRTNKKLATGSSATKKAIHPVALPAPLVTPAPKPTAPVAAVVSEFKPLVAPLLLESKPTTHLAPATPEAKPSAAPLAPTPRSVPVTPMAPAAKVVSPSDREKLIECEAYLLAEKNNFQGDPADYWKKGEALVEANLGRNDGPAWQGAHGTSLGNWGGRLT